MKRVVLFRERLMKCRTKMESLASFSIVVNEFDIGACGMIEKRKQRL
jgi:hypothetical protein